MPKVRFYKCDICGNFIEMIIDSGVNPFCCNEPMREITANVQENVALEKHIPVVKKEGNKITLTVGDVIHPMTDAHYIQWIILVTNKAVHRVDLKPGEQPVAQFALADGEVAVEGYEYCNLHVLWKLTL